MADRRFALVNHGHFSLTAGERIEGLTADDISDSYPEFDARRYGVLADSDGTTGNGTDDTTAWLNAIKVALRSNGLLIGPPGKSRITAVLEMAKINAIFHGEFYKDFDGVGITVTEGGAIFTEFDDIKITGNGSSEASTSHGLSVVDSRMKIKGYCFSSSNGGDGYRHLDDNGNSNHCIIELDCNNNIGHGHYIKKGVTGGNTNNWTVKFGAFSNGGDGVLVDADVKYMRGTVQAEDNTGTGLNVDNGSSWDLDVYLEGNTVEDYNFIAGADYMEIRGRVGSGTDSSTTQRIKLSTGGNSTLLKGNTPLGYQYSANNIGVSGSEYIREEYLGSSGEKLHDVRVYGNEDWALRAYNRSSGAETGKLYYDRSKGQYIFGDGTDEISLFVGANLSRSTPRATTAQLQDISHTVNTHESKIQGSEIYDTTANIPMYATGAADNSTWVGEKAGSTITLTPV